MAAITPHDGPVAVTGCSGFAGGHMVRELILHGYQVRACLRDSGSSRGKDCIQYLKRLPNTDIVDGCDLFKPGSFDHAIAGCSAVFHVAAVLGKSTQPLGSGDRARDIYEGGVKGTQNVINAINASSTVKRMIYTSSMAAVAGAKRQDLPKGYEWTETDWASDGVEKEVWTGPENSYARSKVDTERLIHKAADKSRGKWDFVVLNPAMICGPILFKGQCGQWIEQIGRMAAGDDITWPSKFDMYYNIVDVRDLVTAHRLAAESSQDHMATPGGGRYILHGCGGRSALRLGTEIAAIIGKQFPRFVLALPAMITDEGEPLRLVADTLNDSKKAKSILGVTFRPVEDTIREVVETSIELGIIKPRLK